METEEHDELFCADPDCPLCQSQRDIEEERAAAAGDEAYSWFKDEGRHER